MKVIYLQKGRLILLLMLFFFEAASPSLAQEADGAGADMANSGPAGSQPALLSIDSLPGNASLKDVEENAFLEVNASSNLSQSVSISVPSVPDLSYIWSVSGIEIGQVIMALNQENEILYGQAKYEPDGQDTWNAVVIGSVKEDRVELVLTYLEDSVETSTRLNGTYDSLNQSIRGDLLKVKDGAISERGSFVAIWINPDTSSYTPAVITPKAEPALVESAPSSSEAPMETQVAVKSGFGSEGYYHDVRQDATRILTGVGDLSQIPIGMGGSGLP